jgi:hypothetical protein
MHNHETSNAPMVSLTLIKFTNFFDHGGWFVVPFFCTHIVQKEIELPKLEREKNEVQVPTLSFIIGRWINICSNINCLGILVSFLFFDT